MQRSTRTVLSCTALLLLVAAASSCSESSGPAGPPAGPAVMQVEVTPATLTLDAGAEQQLTATLRDAGGAVVTGPAVQWSSDNTAVATVGSSGLVTSIGAGSATITATSQGRSGTAAVTVRPVQTVATVEVAPAQAEALVGGQTRLTATLRDAAGNVLTEPTVAWSSDDTGIATVDSTGRVTGVAVGAATITATSGGRSGTARVTVRTIEVTTVSGGYNHSCALSASGAAYCWGSGPYGQLGDGSTAGNPRPQPTAVLMPEGVTFASISAGKLRSCALTPGGEAYCWGLNNAGQIGDGTTVNRDRPTAVTMPPGVRFRTISTTGGTGIGNGYVVALSTDGVAYAWGQNNGGGRLGDGTTQDRLVPTRVAMPAGVAFASISAGDGHVLALSTTGTAYAWGLGAYGILGNGTTANRLVPTPVTMPAGVTFASVSAGGWHSVALSTTGAAYSWGWGFHGVLGNGTSGTGTDRWVPTAVTMPAAVSFASIAAGSSGGGHSGHTLALSTTGAAYGWGANDYGRLGDGTTGSRLVPTPVTMPAGVAFRSVSAGTLHSLAVSTSGAAYGWGDNFHGQVGDGTRVVRQVPTAVAIDPASFR
jgi:alpha-tubulin suppressor-like RCC1 family protein